MANPEHVDILKAGTAAVRSWRLDHPRQRMDLANADLRGVQLDGVELGGAELREANFAGADFNAAVLTGADLTGAIACGANLRRACLQQVDLRETDLTNAYLKGTEFSGARSGGTVWNSRELSQALGLDEIVHLGPDVIDIETVLWSAGEWPLAFLRGCGLPENVIANLPEFSDEAPHFERSLVWFVEEDSDFAERLIRAMRQRGLRCWPANLSAADARRDEMRLRVARVDVSLMCVSHAAINHPQLEAEVRSAAARESFLADVVQHRRQLLKVLDLDGAVNADGTQSRLADLAERVVADFSGAAEDDTSFQAGVTQIVRSLTIPRASDSVVVPPVAAGKCQPRILDDPAEAVALSLEEFESLPGQTAGILAGFRRLLRNDGGNSVWFDYRGEKQPTHHLRQLSAGNMLEWETAPLPPGDGGSAACFVWAGSFGTFDEPQTDGFALCVEGKQQLTFDVSRTTKLWRNTQKTVALLFKSHWSSADDVAGFFYLGLSPDLAAPGRTCRISIRTIGVDSERWVGVIPMTDPIERQAAIVSD